MKPFAVLALLLTIASAAGAIDRKAVGTFHAIDGYDFKDLTVQVFSDPVSVELYTPFFNYTLRQAEWDMMLQTMRKAVRYGQIVRDNSMIFDYEKEVGNFTTEENAQVLVRFVTRGWEHCGVEMWISIGGRVTILSMSYKDASDMVYALSAAVNTTKEFQRQIALLN